jgi:uncharacterized protein
LCSRIAGDPLYRHFRTGKAVRQRGWHDRSPTGVANAEQIATSLIAYVETRSALARKSRLDQVDDAALQRHKREFERDWAQLYRLPMDVTTVRRAAELAEQHRLRAYDAVHLATADLLQAAIRAPVAFACFDNALNEVALRLDLKLITDGWLVS